MAEEVKSMLQKFKQNKDIVLATKDE